VPGRECDKCRVVPASGQQIVCGLSGRNEPNSGDVGQSSSCIQPFVIIVYNALLIGYLEIRTFPPALSML